MNATKAGVRNRIHAVEPCCRQITFGAFWFASEDLSIESDQPFPISGDKIGMHVFRADWHSQSLFANVHIGQAKSDARTHRTPKALRANTSRLGVVLRKFWKRTHCPPRCGVFGSF